MARPEDRDFQTTIYNFDNPTPIFLRGGAFEELNDKKFEVQYFEPLRTINSVDGPLDDESATKVSNTLNAFDPSFFKAFAVNHRIPSRAHFLQR